MLSKILQIIEKFTRTKETVEEKTASQVESILQRLSEHGIYLRPEQSKILSFLFHSKRKVKAIEAPTGTGKTLAYLVYILAKIQEYDYAVISTFTKALQDQILSEIKNYFPELFEQVVTAKGKSNYLCLDKLELMTEKERELVTKTKSEKLKEVTVSTYYCNEKYRSQCPFRERCEYLRALSEIPEKKVIITNHFYLPALFNLLKKHTDGKVLLIVDECHTFPEKQTIEVTEEDLVEPAEPDPKNFASLREYNLALERYYRHVNKFTVAKKHGITSPGRYVVDVDVTSLFLEPAEVIFFSATLPERFPVGDEEVDLILLSDTKSWAGVKIIVKNTNYRDEEYQRILFKTVEYAKKSYDKVIILATSYQQLKLIKSKFPEAKTTLEEKAIVLAEKLKAGEIQIIAGTDVFWTGIDVPGRKCIIMTKLPFPVPDSSSNDREEEAFITGYQTMLRKFKQGIGRMVRSSRCEGEVIILDNRVTKYPEVVDFISGLEKRGAKVIFESSQPGPAIVDKTDGTDKVIRIDWFLSAKQR